MLKQLALAGVAVTTLLGVAPATSAPVPSTMIARRFNDGLDSRFAGTEVSAALAALGYSGTNRSNGTTAATAWSDGKSATVFGVFGHANAGIAQTDEGPTDSLDEILAAGQLTDVNFRNWAFWSQYLHYVDVDDMRLAIFAGCYTANVDPVLSSFGNVGEQRGVDSIVGFTDLVFFPAFCTTCNYSGNYFWSRFATYARANDTVAVALAKARNDIVALEGDSGGWHLWKFDGALPAPGDVRLGPAGAGQGLNSKPFGIDPFDLLKLPTTRRTTRTVNGERVVDVETTVGISYRVDADTGQLRWLSGPASTEGAPPMSESEAEQRAIAFIEAEVPWYDRAAGIETRSAPTHADDDALFGYQWRLRTPAGPGPARIDVEVDRRTGSIVYFSAHRVGTGAGEVRMSRDDAVALARRAAGAATADVVGAVTDVWRGPRWTVTLDRPGVGLTPDLVQVVIDAATGAVLGVRAT